MRPRETFQIGHEVHFLPLFATSLHIQHTIGRHSPLCQPRITNNSCMTVTYGWFWGPRREAAVQLNQALIAYFSANFEDYGLIKTPGLIPPLACAAARAWEKTESADKPGSVVSNHSSGTTVTSGLKQPTRKHPRAWLLQCNVLPYLVLLQVGFTVPRSVATRAVRSYRTISPLPAACKQTAGGIFSVALSVGSRLPGVTWHPARRSPDFPPGANTARLPGRLRRGR